MSIPLWRKRAMKQLLESIIKFIRDYNKSRSAIKTFIQAKGFRGFKRFPIVVYGNEIAEQNNERLSYEDMSGKRIIFKPQTGNPPFYAIYIENYRIGAIFDKEQISSIKNNKFTDVYVKFEEENVISKIGVLKTHRARLFVKYKEK